MKKLILILTAFLLAGCSWLYQNKVESLEFYANDGSLPPQHYSEATMKIVPDYAKRTLTVDYARAFPYRTNETIEEDVKVEGAVLGGENFDKFSDTVDFVMNYEKEHDEEGIVVPGGGVFTATVTSKNGKVFTVDMSYGGEDDGFEGVRTFYFDLSKLLTENEQV
jgi:hypothetical protein